MFEWISNKETKLTNRGDEMNKVTILIITGIFLFMTGIYVSAFLSANWVMIGTAFTVGGGIITGGSSYFLINTKNSQPPK